MSLHDRIMAMSAPDNVLLSPLCMGGFSVAQQEAAEIAKQADAAMRRALSGLEAAQDVYGVPGLTGIIEELIEIRETAK